MMKKAFGYSFADDVIGLIWCGFYSVRTLLGDSMASVPLPTSPYPDNRSSPKLQHAQITPLFIYIAFMSVQMSPECCCCYCIY